MIFTEETKNKYPFASKFFELALTSEKSRFAQGFILSGNNISYQYKFVLEIAKYLNCTKDKTPDCNCINCSWINENAHPAIITISPIDFIEKPKTKISVEQIRKLRSSLGVTSPYHRVIIITDAKEIESDLPYSAPKVSSDKEKRKWTPLGLTQGVFGRAPANALLKILEEPSDMVTFFFLTQNKDDLLPTIISRCQSINLASKEPDTDELYKVAEFVEQIPYQNIEKALEAAKKLQEISSEIPIEILLNMMQKLIKNNLLSSVENRVTFLRGKKLLEKLEDAKLQLKSFVQPKNVIDNLFLNFYQN